MMKQEKRGKIVKNEELVATTYKMPEHKCITTTQNKNFLISFILL